MRRWLKRIAIAAGLTLVVIVVAGASVYLANRDIIVGEPLLATPVASSLRVDFPPASGWSPQELEAARVVADELGSTAVIAISDGRLVAEWGDTARRISGHSVRKSLVSALYGIAVDKGLIDVDRTLAELDLDDEPPLTEAERQARLTDLLAARSGIYHDSVKADMEGNRPARGEHAPGTHFFYNNWSFNALGGMFEQLTDMSLGEAFKQWISDPIGMQDFRVEDVRYQTGEESVYPAYRFWISARDLARFGELFLREGRWGDEQIISPGWIKRSTTPYSDVGDGWGYGYMWWTLPEGGYLATGTGGQKLFVDPARKLVVVNRVDTGEGLRRGLWFKYGNRVNNREFFGLIDWITAATN